MDEAQACIQNAEECWMQVAYLASSLFLDHNSDLIILVVNTLTQDLKSENYLTGTPAILHA